MKRINIQKDVASRQKIASSPKRNFIKPSKSTEDAKRYEAHSQIINNQKQINNAENKEIQRGEINQTSTESPSSQKRERKTKRDIKEV